MRFSFWSFLMFFVAVTFGYCAMAQAAVVPPTFLDGIIAFVKGPSASTVSIIAGILLEVALRVWPTAKPMSIFVVIKYVVDGLVIILGWLSGIIAGLIGSMNNVSPTP